MRTKPVYVGGEEVSMGAQAAFLCFPLEVEVAPKTLDALWWWISRMEGAGEEIKDRLLFLKKLYSKCQKCLELGSFHRHGLLEGFTKVVSFKMEHINKGCGIECFYVAQRQLLIMLKDILT